MRIVLTLLLAVSLFMLATYAMIYGLLTALSATVTHLVCPPGSRETCNGCRGCLILDDTGAFAGTVPAVPMQGNDRVLAAAKHEIEHQRVMAFLHDFFSKVFLAGLSVAGALGSALECHARQPRPSSQ